MEFFVWLQATSWARWVGESESLWAYPTILTLHTVGLALVVGANAVLDFRIIGLGPDAPLAAFRKVFRPMWIGFAVNAASGVALFAAAAEFTGAKPIFWVKLGLVAAGLAVILLKRRAILGAQAEALRPGTRALAVASLIIWTAVIAAGRYTAYAR
jgi:hypothetical protein